MNDCIRNDWDGCRIMKEHYERIAKKIDDSLTYLPNYEGETYRGMIIDLEDNNDFEVFVKDLEDNNILFKGFTSSTIDPETATGFAGRGRNPNSASIILTLNGKYGKDISAYSAFGSDEQEVLFGTDSEWTVRDHFWSGTEKEKYYEVILDQI